MTEDMVERVARAFCERGIYKWEETTGAMREWYLQGARAAIAAMREPTEAMLSDGDSAIPPAEANIRGERMMGREVCLEAWQAMIDAALK